MADRPKISLESDLRPLGNPKSLNRHYSLERGRKLENVTDQYLEEHFIEEVRQWAKTPPPWQPFDALNDIISECFLRGFNLPVEPVRAYFDQINAVVEATPRDEEAGEAFMKEVVTRYEKAKAIEN